MGALGHYIEAEGVATVGISLVREHSERIRPPRTLWTPYEFGRPLGVPNDHPFQREVLRAALGLVRRPGPPPVLEDHLVEAPAGPADGDGEAGWACPVALPPPDPGVTEADRLARAVLDEVARLRPWFDEACRVRGRTSFGVSGLLPNDIDTAVELLARFGSGETVEPPPATSVPMPRLLRYLADDAKAFYLEAATATPSRVPPSGETLARWLYTETVLGGVLFRVRERLAASDDVTEQRAQGGIVPGVYVRLQREAEPG